MLQKIARRIDALTEDDQGLPIRWKPVLDFLAQFRGGRPRGATDDPRAKAARRAEGAIGASSSRARAAAHTLPRSPSSHPAARKTGEAVRGGGVSIHRTRGSDRPPRPCHIDMCCTRDTASPCTSPPSFTRGSSRRPSARPRRCSRRWVSIPLEAIRLFYRQISFAAAGCPSCADAERSRGNLARSGRGEDDRSRLPDEMAASWERCSPLSQTTQFAKDVKRQRKRGKRISRNWSGSCGSWPAARPWSFQGHRDHACGPWRHSRTAISNRTGCSSILRMPRPPVERTEPTVICSNRTSGHPLLAGEPSAGASSRPFTDGDPAIRN